MDSYNSISTEHERKYSNGQTVYSETHRKLHLSHREGSKVCYNAGTPQIAMYSFVFLGNTVSTSVQHNINKHTKNVLV